ncbi:MAG: hypothetical protein HY701_11175, partial [Gemmatimonadetes bacterium]|nr:hypothetical protein [Gemmatimonadota bacterium]
EKRPFVLESADVLTTPINAVFTRTVADPLAGVKLTGNVGASAIGLFAARDRITNLIFPANQGSAADFLDQDAYSLVGRYRHDVGGSSSVGALFTGRFGEDYRNALAGADAFLQFTRSNSLRAQLLLSSTEYPRALATSAGQVAGTFAGSAASLELIHASRNWFAGLSYEDLSPEFRADLGFVPQVDVRTMHAGLSRVFRRASGGWFTQINISPFARRTQDHGGRLTDQLASLEIFYQGPSQTQFQVEVTRAQELFADVLYGLSRAFISFNTRPTGDTHFGGFVDFGDAIDFTNARASTSVILGPFFSVNLFDRLSLEASYRDQRLAYHGDQVFRAKLFQPRVVYHLGRRAFVRAIVQYRRVDRTPSLYSVPVNVKDESVLTQLLFSYKVNPQTVWFVGYGDNYLGTERYDLTQRSRTFFTKLGYAWRP